MENEMINFFQLFAFVKDCCCKS